MKRKVHWTEKVKRAFLSFKKDSFKLLVLVIFLVGFAIRFLGVYPGYSPYHPDEGKAGYSSAWYMLEKKTLDLPHYHYPALIPTIQLIFLIVVFVPLLWLKLLWTSPDIVLSRWDKLGEVWQNYIAGRSDIEVMYMSRYLSAAIGFFTLVLTYLVAKELFKSRLIAALSTAVLAVNMRQIMSNQLDLPDGYSGFFLLLAFYMASKLKERSALKQYILSGITVGLAISTKLQLFSLLPLVLVHLYHVFTSPKWWPKVKTLFGKNIILSLIALLITLVLINIGPLRHWSLFVETVTHVSNLYGFGVNKFSLTGAAFFYQVVLTPAVAIAALLGVAVGLFKDRFSTFLVFSLISLYLYYFLYFTKAWYYPRNFVSIIPFFALMAGVGLGSLWPLLKRVFPNLYLARGALGIVVLGVLWQSIGNSLVHTLAYMQPWNMTSIRACIKQNIASGKAVAAHPTDKYFLFALPSTDVEKKLTFLPFDLESTYTLAEIQDQKADYALVGLDVVGDQNSVWWMTKSDVWRKPTDVSNNVFISLAAKELFISTVCSKVKPWQAVENNYVFVSIPPKMDLQWLKLNQEEFTKGSSNFIKIDGFEGKGENLMWDEKEGKDNPGSLKIKAIVPRFPVARWISPVFAVLPGRVYKAEGWVKGAVSLEQKRRDGFLRLDFYQNEPTVWDEGTKSLSTNLSARYFGPKDWQKLEVIGVAPANAQLATVSFQISNFSVSDFWLDDLAIYQSIADAKLTATSSGQKLILDPDVFVPNLGSGY